MLTDIGFASSENRMFIGHELKRHFVMPLKSHRKVALSLDDKKRGHYHKIDTLPMEAGMARDIWLEGVDVPLVLAKQVFTNEEAQRVFSTLAAVTLTSCMTASPQSTKNGGTRNAITSH